MGRYEEVRDRAVNVMTDQAMANAAMQAGNVEEALKYAESSVQFAEDILKEYEDVGASYVVYCNATGFRFQLLDSLEDNRNAFFSALIAVYSTYSFLSERMENETFCCLFATQLMQMFISYRSYSEEVGFFDEGNENGQLAFETLVLIFQLMHNAYDQLKKVAPDNPMVAPMSNILQQMIDAGLERYEELADLDWETGLDRVYDNLVAMKIINE